jgi:hypothetical protein
MLSRRSQLRRPAAGALALVAVMGAATACGSSDASDSAGSKPPSISAAASPSPSATTAPAGHDAGLPTRFPKQQLTVVELPRTKGAERAALATYLRFESLVRESLRTHHVSPALRTLSSTPLFNTIVSSANNMRDKSIVLSGPTRLAVTRVRSAVNLVALDLCFDVTKARQVVHGTPQPLDGPPRAKARSVLTDEGGRWRVTEYTFNGDSC